MGIEIGLHVELPLVDEHLLLSRGRRRAMPALSDCARDLQVTIVASPTKRRPAILQSRHRFDANGQPVHRVRVCHHGVRENHLPDDARLTNMVLSPGCSMSGSASSNMTSVSVFRGVGVGCSTAVAVALAAVGDKGSTVCVGCRTVVSVGTAGVGDGGKTVGVGDSCAPHASMHRLRTIRPPRKVCLLMRCLHVFHGAARAAQTSEVSETSEVYTARYPGLPRHDLQYVAHTVAACNNAPAR